MFFKYYILRFSLSPKEPEDIRGWKDQLANHYLTFWPNLYYLKNNVNIFLPKRFINFFKQITTPLPPQSCEIIPKITPAPPLPQDVKKLNLCRHPGENRGPVNY